MAQALGISVLDDEVFEDEHRRQIAEYTGIEY